MMRRIEGGNVTKEREGKLTDCSATNNGYFTLLWGRHFVKERKRVMKRWRERVEGGKVVRLTTVGVCLIGRVNEGRIGIVERDEGRETGAILRERERTFGGIFKRGELSTVKLSSTSREEMMMMMMFMFKRSCLSLCLLFCFCYSCFSMRFLSAQRIGIGWHFNLV